MSATCILNLSCHFLDTPKWHQEKKRGWKLLVERTENDIEWFVREQVRRERQLEQVMQICLPMW